MPSQFTEVLIGSPTPLHPCLANNPTLFLKMTVNRKLYAKVRAIMIDSESGIWELESDLDIPSNVQVLTFDIVRSDKTHEKKIVSATLKVSTLLKRIKIDPEHAMN